MDPLLIVALVAVLAAVVLGWWIGGRSAAAAQKERDAARAESESWRGKLNETEKELVAAKGQADAADLLRRTLDEVSKERDVAMSDAAGLRPVAARAASLDKELADLRAEKEALAAVKAAHERGEAERQQAYEAQLAQLREFEKKLETQFGVVARQALDVAQEQFLKRADEKLGHTGKQSEAALKALLQPVEASLRAHKETIEKVEASRTEAYGSLTGIIGEMKAGQEAVRSEAAKLANSLRSAPKARGRWGEQQLRNVLETCGLTEHCDFEAEVSVSAEEGRLRPDVIVRIPGGKTLVIDAKVSLNAYQDAFGAVDEQERSVGLAAHAAAMKAHVNGLGNKAYWAQFAEAPDYVIMFVPGEHFLSAALEHDPTLWDFAFEKRVLLATPTNLIAIARTVAVVWRQEKMADEAKRIGALGKEMYDRLAVAAGKLKTVGTGLGTAVRNYNDFVSSFESRVMVTGRRFKELNVEVGSREMDDLQPLDALPRYADSDEPTTATIQLAAE